MRERIERKFASSMVSINEQCYPIEVELKNEDRSMLKRVSYRRYLNVAAQTINDPYQEKTKTHLSRTVSSVSDR